MKAGLVSRVWIALLIDDFRVRRRRARNGLVELDGVGSFWAWSWLGEARLSLGCAEGGMKTGDGLDGSSGRPSGLAGRGGWDDDDDADDADGDEGRLLVLVWSVSELVWWVAAWWTKRVGLGASEGVLSAFCWLSPGGGWGGGLFGVRMLWWVGGG